jgi:hypothetical protein
MLLFYGVSHISQPLYVTRLSIHRVALAATGLGKHALFTNPVTKVLTPQGMDRSMKEGGPCPLLLFYGRFHTTQPMDATKTAHQACLRPLLNRLWLSTQ